ncbi:MAG: glycoside hydrolase family 1 protein [Firmicutes bacterium]|nr:glycoside hydrolase family 1 protein [Bacillota bacterium]
MKQFLQFPQAFWWGAATSGPQSEGSYNKKHESLMDYWYRTTPEDFFNQVGPTVASDFYNQYENDFKLLKEIGLNSYRTSIQWTRLIDDLEEGSVNPEGLAFYKKIAQEAKKNDIELVFNLHHFDIPIELVQKYGGWTSKHVTDLFAKFAKCAFENLGKEVKYWVTFNEPIVIVEASYLDGHHYPKYVGHGKEAAQVMYNLALASAKAIQEYKKLNLDGKIGIILNLTPSYPRSEEKEDILAGQIADDMLNRSFLEPAVLGHFPPRLISLFEKEGILWESCEEELQIIEENKVDFLGLNYYHPNRVKAPEKEVKFPPGFWLPLNYFNAYQKPDIRMNPYRGWEIYPKAIYDIAMDIKNNYGNIPWYISENGMGVEGEERFLGKDGIIHDTYRIDFYEEHLSWLHKAIQEGSNCFGFHAWTGIDCWSWANAYKNRYGFISVDLNTQKHTIKQSGRWIKNVVEQNGFESKYEL